MTKRQGCRTLILGHILGSMMLYLADAYGTDRLQAVAEEAEKQTNPETSREGLIPMCPARRILSFGSLGIRACFEQSGKKGWRVVLLAPVMQTDA